MFGINSPQYTGIPMDFYNQQNTAFMNPPMASMPSQLVNNQQMMPQQMMRPQQQQIDPRVFDTPEIVSTGKKMFTVVDEGAQAVTIPVDIDIPDGEKAKKTSKKSKVPKPEASTAMVRVNDGPVAEKLNGTVEETPTAYSYMETNAMIRDTIGQIDALNAELVGEFQSVLHNRTMKNKYNVLIGLSENIGSLIGNRIQAIKEANNSITKSNDMDYKKLKDAKAAQAQVNDDKYIADVYQSLISNKQNMPAQYNFAPVDSSSLYNSGIVRADIIDTQLGQAAPMDLGYMNYVANMTPEQNLMRYEGNPNVKQVVIFDAASGAKVFKMMDMSTGQIIENVPTYDESIMEDTTLDVKNKIAKNINLNQTFPIIVINDDITSQY